MYGKGVFLKFSVSTGFDNRSNGHVDLKFVCGGDTQITPEQIISALKKLPWVKEVNDLGWGVQMGVKIIGSFLNFATEIVLPTILTLFGVRDKLCVPPLKITKGDYCYQEGYGWITLSEFMDGNLQRKLSMIPIE